MLTSMYHDGVSTLKDLNPDRLEIARQIRIDLDFYNNGVLCMLHIANTSECDMAEYSRAVKFLETLPAHVKMGADAVKFRDHLIQGIRIVEKEREAHGGLPFKSAWRAEAHKMKLAQAAQKFQAITRAECP